MAHRRAGRLPSVPNVLSVLALLAVLSGVAGCNSMFFYPNDKLYFTPDRFGLWHEEVTFEAADGTELTGWYLPAKTERPLGTIIHFHGNAANISNHVYAVRWLPWAGFSVFVFDYRGYGASGGRPTREGVISDGVAAIEHVRARPDVESGRIVVYGQSLGGAVAISALARAGTDGVAALVVESSFHSYRQVVRMVLADAALTWPFQYPVAYLFFSDSFAPAGDLPTVADLPFLVIHGQADATVPVEAGKRLYKAFPGEDKELWLIPGAGHMQIFGNNSPWRERLVDYLREKLPRPPPPPGYRYRSAAGR